MGVTVTRDRFEQMVADALDSIPPELGDAMDNVVVVVEEWPTSEQLGGRGGMLLGLDSSTGWFDLAVRPDDE